MPLRDLTVLFILLGTLPKVIFQPHIGVYLWSWVGYMNPHRLGWGFMYNYPIAQLTGGVTLLAYVFSGERKSLPNNSAVYVWIIFIIWMCITTTTAIHQADAKLILDKVLKIQLFIALTMVMINSRKRIEMLVWVIALSIGFFGIKGGVFTIVHGGQFMVLGPEGSFISGNTEIGLATVVILPLLNYLRFNSQNIWIRRALLVSMVLCAFTIVGTHSRGAFLAGGAMAFFLWVKSSQKLVLGILLFFSIVTIALFLPQKYYDKMATIQTYEEDASAMGRINAWWTAYNIAKDKIMGGGFETFSPYTFKIYAPVPDDYHDAHSIYFEVLGEHGFIGLMIYCILGILTWNNARFVIQWSRNVESLAWANGLARMIQVSLIGFGVGGAFLGLAYFDLPYHLMAILILLREIVEKEIYDIQNNT